MPTPRYDKVGRVDDGEAKGAGGEVMKDRGVGERANIDIDIDI